MTEPSSQDSTDQMDREEQAEDEAAPSGGADRAPSSTTFDRSDSGFTRCTNCRMVVRRSELEIHLAHAHDIGPRQERKGGKPRRGGGGRSSGEGRS